MPRKKVQGLWPLLKGIAKEDRADIVATVRRIAEDPEIGDRIKEVPPGTTTCPCCEDTLLQTVEELGWVMIGHGSRDFRILDCPKCGCAFSEKIM